MAEQEDWARGSEEQPGRKGGDQPPGCRALHIIESLASAEGGNDPTQRQCEREQAEVVRDLGRIRPVGVGLPERIEVAPEEPASRGRNDELERSKTIDGEVSGGAS